MRLAWGRTLERRRVGGRWFGGIGGVLLEPGFEFGEALLVVLNQG
jgi:hypothetical protein